MWQFAILPAIEAVTSYFDAEAEKKAGEKVSDAASAEKAALADLMSPYTRAGAAAMQEQQNLMGLNGADAQQTAISGIESSPQFTAMTQQGENAILQNASATGGLRGGNTQGALAQFRPQVLNSLVNQRLGQLGNLTSLGQNSALGIGNTSAQLGMQGAGAEAQSIINQTQAYTRLPGNIMEDSAAMFGALGGFSGGVGGTGGMGGL